MSFSKTLNTKTYLFSTFVMHSILSLLCNGDMQ